MQGWRVHQLGHYNEALNWEPCPDPECPDEGVVIDVHAAALNFPDLLAIAGRYQVRPPLPFTPGLEASGVVRIAGPKSRFSVGDRVIANHNYGAFAEQMAATDASCFEIPETMEDAAAAALLITYQTGYFALQYRAALRSGETLLVHGGAGGVGTAAIQIGKAMGARVIATAGSKAKLQVCRDCGADNVINYRDADFVSAVRDLTDGRGADVIYDPVGGDVFDGSTKCIAFNGRLLVIGFTSGRIPELRLNRVLLKNISVIGLYWGSYQKHDPGLIHATHHKLCEMHTKGDIVPVIFDKLPMEKLPEGLAALEGRESYGKIVVTPSRLPS